MSRTWSNTWANIKREKFMSISNVLILSVTFLVLGIFILVISASQTALRYLEKQAQITIFLKDDFLEENIYGLKSDLEQDSRISEVKYVSKEDAYKIFTELNKDEPILLESISVSILPASLEIKTHDIKHLSEIAEEVSKVDGVEEVRFFKDIIERFRFWSHVVYILGFVLAVVFLSVSYAVVLATLRATISSQGVELEIQKLVGASDAYVRLPLVYQGVLFGTVSSLVSSILIILLGFYINKLGWFSSGFSFGFLPSLFINPLVFSLLLSLVLVFSGVALGFIGSYTAIKRYLKY